MRLKNILVPTDFGESSQGAEELAVELAAKLGGRVTLLHAWTILMPSYAEAISSALEDIERAARGALEVRHALLKEKYANCDAVLAAGTAWDVILATAERTDADMIVMGTHGRRGLPRFVLGSVAEKVVRLAKVPVVTVSPEGSRAPIRRILLPIDVGPASDAAVERAAALASELDAEVTVLHVYEVPIHVYPGAPYVPLYDTSPALKEIAEAAVERVVHQLEGRVRRVVGLVRQGSAWRNIDEVAEEVGADLVVLGTHGRRGAAHALIGSVAEKVVRTSRVPALTVHATEPKPIG